MGNCKVFTNSVSDLPSCYAQQYNIGIVPDIVIVKGKEYFCTIDIDPPAMYGMMRGMEELPGTSHPNEYIYTDCFRTAQAYDEILCITVTSIMSGSYSTASAAARTLAEEGFGPRIHVYDSAQVSCGQTLMVLEAAKMAGEGKSAQEIIRHLDLIKNKVKVYFVMRSLKNAKKGGRVGEIKCLAADLLGIHPILAFREGTIKEARLMHSFGKAVLHLRQYYRKSARRGGKVLIYHADNEPDAQRLKEQVLECDPQADVHVDWIGPAIGIYAGEGTIGIAFME